ncbi:hypothetical protein ACJIZ3_010862 [Penstemon smallii]|uniref:Uncharacterized protein n=1 Tax=Penstemon smallii TaxID=265156 RepID=A0ABD3UL31_9LAMI
MTKIHDIYLKYLLMIIGDKPIEGEEWLPLFFNKMTRKNDAKKWYEAPNLASKSPFSLKIGGN